MVFYDEEGRIKWPTLLLTVGVTLILIGFLWMGIDKLSVRQLEQSITNGFATVDQIAQRVTQTRDKWKNNYLLFADHWSTGLDNQIAIAEYNVGPEGAKTDLQSALTALQQSKRQEADQHATRAEEKLNQATQTADYVLGTGWTVGLYDRLHSNTSIADSTLNAAQTCITTTWGSITAYEDSDNYADGVNDLVQAQSSLDLANTTNVTIIERGLIDKPLVYDYAIASKSSCDQALADAMPTPPTPVPPTPKPDSGSPIIIIIDNNPSTETEQSNPIETSPIGSDPFESITQPSESLDLDIPDTTSWDEPSLETPSDNTSWDNEDW